MPPKLQFVRGKSTPNLACLKANPSSPWKTNIAPPPDFLTILRS